MGCKKVFFKKEANKGTSNKTDNGWTPFSCFTFRVPVFCMLTYWDTSREQWQGFGQNLNQINEKSMLRASKLAKWPFPHLMDLVSYSPVDCCWIFLKVISVMFRLLTYSVSCVDPRLERVEERSLLRASWFIYSFVWTVVLIRKFFSCLSVQWLIIPRWWLTILWQWLTVLWQWLSCDTSSCQPNSLPLGLSSASLLIWHFLHWASKL